MLSSRGALLEPPQRLCPPIIILRSRKPSVSVDTSQSPLVGNTAPQEFVKGIALRGLFTIDMKGIIQHSTMNNLAIGRSVDETIRTFQPLQYVQENPDEVCPGGWKPGEKSMKHSTKLSKEYFSAI